MKWLILSAILLAQMLQGIVGGNNPRAFLAQTPIGNSSGANSDSVSSTITSSTQPLIIVGAFKVGDSDSVLGVTDNIGNTYVQAASARGQFGSQTTDIWYCANASPGVTTVTTQWGVTSVVNKGNAIIEVGGLANPALDIAAHGVVGGSGNVVAGASVTPTSTSGVIIAIMQLGSGTITQNPDSGNEFTAGGNTIHAAIYGQVSLLSPASGAHNAAWHTSGATPNEVNSIAAFK